MAEKDTKTLLKELRDKREKLREFRFGVTGSKIKNIREARTLRKDIARLLTKLNAGS